MTHPVFVCILIQRLATRWTQYLSDTYDPEILDYAGVYIIGSVWVLFKDLVNITEDGLANLVQEVRSIDCRLTDEEDIHVFILSDLFGLQLQNSEMPQDQMEQTIMNVAFYFGVMLSKEETMGIYFDGVSWNNKDIMLRIARSIYKPNFEFNCHYDEFAEQGGEIKRRRM